MSTQRRLLDPGPGLANLSAREQIVFDYLQANPSGKRAFDIGRHLHMRKANPCLYCSDDRTCQYASRDANMILRELRGHREDPHARKLVRYRREFGYWELTPQARTHDQGTFPPDF